MAYYRNLWLPVGKHFKAACSDFYVKYKYGMFILVYDLTCLLYCLLLCCHHKPALSLLE